MAKTIIDAKFDDDALVDVIVDFVERLMVQIYARRFLRRIERRYEFGVVCRLCRFFLEHTRKHASGVKLAEGAGYCARMKRFQISVIVTLQRQI